jgi:hypothetical protein
MGAWCETDETAHRGLQKLRVLRPEGVQRIDSAPGFACYTDLSEKPLIDAMASARSRSKKGFASRGIA